MPPTPRTSSKLPLAAVISILVLVGTGWAFFLATFELSKVNYERKRAKVAASNLVERSAATNDNVANDHARGQR